MTEQQIDARARFRQALELHAKLAALELELDRLRTNRDATLAEMRSLGMNPERFDLRDFESLYRCQALLTPTEAAEEKREAGEKCSRETRRWPFEQPTREERLFCDDHLPEPEVREAPKAEPASLLPVPDGDLPF